MSVVSLVISLIVTAVLAVIAWTRFVDLNADQRPKRAAIIAGSILICVGVSPIIDTVADLGLSAVEHVVLGALLGLGATVAAPLVLRILRRKGGEL